MRYNKHMKKYSLYFLGLLVTTLGVYFIVLPLTAGFFPICTNIHSWSSPQTAQRCDCLGYEYFYVKNLAVDGADISSCIGKITRIIRSQP